VHNRLAEWLCAVNINKTKEWPPVNHFGPGQTTFQAELVSHGTYFCVKYQNDLKNFATLE